jgi:hypothetical protein
MIFFVRNSIRNVIYCISILLQPPRIEVVKMGLALKQFVENKANNDYRKVPVPFIHILMKGQRIVAKMTARSRKIHP